MMTISGRGWNDCGMQVREIRARDRWAGLLNVDIQIPLSVFAWLLDGRCALSCGT